MPRLSVASPIGRLTLFEEGSSLAALDWGGDKSAVFSNADEIAFALHERYDPGAP